MKIAINIDFVIRDWYSALLNAYRKKIDEDYMVDLREVASKDLWEYFPFPQYIETSQSLITSDENGVEYDDPIQEVSTVEDRDKPYVTNMEVFNQFCAEHVLEIFGHASESEKDIILYLNQYQKKNRDIIIILYSHVKGKAIPATLFFLSKFGCELTDIKFIGTEEFHYDLINAKVIDKDSLKGSLKELDFRSL